MIRYPWLNIIYNQILNAYRKDRGHHALLLNSKRNNGENTLIYAIARWLICSRPNENQYCNICYDCRLMNVGHHPDYYEISPENNTQTIGVDTIRVCINSIYNHAHQNKVKIIYVKKHVEYLTDQAINVLLKTLDDPPTNTYFFLKTRDCMRMSLTLLSRCMRWSIISPKESIGLQWLMKNREGINNILLAQCALRLCDGSPIEAEEMFKLGLWKQRLDLCKCIHYVITNRDFLKLVPFLSTCKNDMYLYWLITVLVDALKWKQGIKKRFIINLDQFELITVVTVHWDIVSLSRQLQQWLVLSRYFQEFNNVDRELLLTYRLLNWQQGTVESCWH
ncbi:DNA polymerase III subunit delta' [Blochmannia endosymbiont of Camponotus sp. C-003]|uniref:DNA polymerase III subunit delta' C-terminal domain-containing protein n=1 Tax=unclassified Candidatus Blochmanniella TaxID=711328 RepID=UPI002024C4A5|nr:MULTISPECIES: DNA polymerase III subunit delta' C-terminal domain-containing protein [unclassified Candidatus Blochmannia]URJ23420.1 DNA polymerase III subunit delta' [Blochmannia endosymbiont of Camponotus sp. C-003]URJ28892.1 DNA polymerase III subunit delta' [Blochmannia endosymbiont of Camponotus sp. C-046]